VLCSDEGYEVLSGIWPERITSDEINEHELLVVGIALDGFPRIADGDLHIVMDNTSAISAMSKPISKDRLLSQVAAKVKAKMPQTRVTSSYLNTRLNPSDEPSRGKPLRSDKLSVALGR